MKPTLALLAVAAVAAALFASTRLAPATTAAPRLFSPPRELVQYGHVKSLVRTGTGYELRFDPALWLEGATANRAAVEDKVIAPGDTIPNDYYIRDEGHRLLTYAVPANAHVSVVTNGPGMVRSTTVSVAELAQIVKGGNPKHRPLMEPKAGFWVRVATDTVRSLDQQYQP